ncbi:MAG TPA: pseudouridine synthase [Gaiellales bacterium]
MPVRLNRYLASTGVASRRGADDLISSGRVTVNGARAQLGTLVSDADDVRLDGQPVSVQATTVVLLHKPGGVVTTARDTQGRPTVVDLVPSPVRLFPVGRLDRQTTGALLLTNDGELADRLMHPRNGVAKTYVATVGADPPPAKLRRLREGVELDDGPTAPAHVRIVAARRVEITIHEGRNRQVRRMLDAVGHPARALHRSRYAGLGLGDLGPGEWRTLEAAEIEALRRA